MDLLDYQALYLEGAHQSLEELRRFLARLEAGMPRPEEVEAAYRAAHTLKGDSAVMGYDAMSALAREIEIPLKKATLDGAPLPPDFAATLRTALRRLEAALAALPGS